MATGTDLPVEPGQEPPILAPQERPWHALGIEEALGRLGTPVEQGLPPTEVTARLAEHGENRLPETRRPSLAKLVLRQIGDVTVLALIAAALIALLIALIQGEGSTLERYGDTGAIMGIVVLNALLGIFQLQRADKALAALEELTAPTATVLRGGKEQEIPAALVVPGDLLLLEEGDRIAADARLVQATNVQVSEAALTGESHPVAKSAEVVLDGETALAERHNMVYAGTTLGSGRALAVVTATGLGSEVGRIASMVKEAKTEPTPLERDLRRFGLVVVVACVLASCLVFAIGIARGGQSVRHLFLIAVTLAVAAIPEGLPAITTIVLALGTHAMAKRGALVRRLHAVETLGCIRVLCVDKTGTITRNQMKVVRVAAGGVVWRVNGGGDPPASVGAAVQVAGGARGKDSTDLALQEMARAARVPVVDLPLVDEVPFTSERRLGTTVFGWKSGFLVTTRGAYERVLEICDRVVNPDGSERPMEDADRDATVAMAEDWAKDAIRVLALASCVRSVCPEGGWEQGLAFGGLVGIADPLRPEVKLAVARARQAGIQVMMITGDHPTTARAVAKEAGILVPGSEVVLGRELERWSDEELGRRLPRIAVVARATAADKLRILQGFRSLGEVAGMTGDGVNDAPALKTADIGVAMGKGGTDVAREASAMVLADDNFATIVAAVSEGRAIYANIRRFITFLFASNVGLVLAVSLASILGWDQPMAPIQILWINVITNGLPALALGLEPSLEDRMKQPPRRPDAPILQLHDALRIVVVGALIAGGGLWAFYEACGGDPSAATPAARTAAFTVFALAPLLYAFAARSDDTPLWRLGPLTNTPLIGAVIMGVGLQAVAVFVPGTQALFRTGAMSGADWGRVLLAASIPYVVVELWKLVSEPRRG